MRPLKILLVVCLSAAGLAAAAFGSGTAKSPGAQTTPQGIGGYLAVPYPKQAALMAKAVAKASFSRKYDTVWSYLHPSYQKAISESHWKNCQGSHPAAPPGVTIQRVAVASANKLPTKLPLLGTKSIQEIQLQVQFARSGQGSQYALVYTFWLQEGKTWHAVWLPEEYSALKSGKCYLNQLGQPGLY
jgi:hypothetical protein